VREQVGQPLTQKMEDRSGGDNRESDSVSRAANLLTRAVELLSNDGSSAVSNRGGACSADSSTSSASSCGSALQPPPSSSEEWRTQATANFQRIFRGLQHCSHDQWAGGRTGSRNSGKSAKRTLNPATGQWFWKRGTWTHKFYCFHKTDQIGKYCDELDWEKRGWGEFYSFWVF